MTLLAEHHDTVILLLALLSAVAAFASLFTSLRKPVVIPPPPPSPAVPAATASAPEKSSKDDDSSDSDSDDEKSKDKKKQPALINDAYKLLHQRYNRQTYSWEEFDPVKDGEGHDGVIFIVYHRHHDPSGVRPLERIVEVHSEVLKDVLRGSLKHVDTVFDPKPMVDAQKLFTHDDLLKEELAKIQVQLSLAEQADKEKKDKDGETEPTEHKPADEAKPDENPFEGNSQKSEKPSIKSSLVNGVEPKQKLLNGDSTDNDSTAVNTPGSSTPLLKAPSNSSSSSSSSDATEGEEEKQPKETDPDSIIPTVESLRLQFLHLQKLMDFLHEEFGPTRQKLSDLLENNDIKFGLLWCLFRLGSVITFKDRESGLNMAGEITSAEYMRRGDQQEYFEIHVRYIDYNGSSFYYSWQRLEIPFFKDLRKIRSLSAQPLTDDELKEQLKARGACFVKLKGTHYLEYHDSLYQRRNFGLESRILKFRAEGRAMVDCASYQKMNPMSYVPDVDEEDKLDTVDDSDLHFCAPTVFGYSFVTKMWGRLVADKFSPIEWNKAAFEHLVLPETTKTLIKSLVDADRAGAEVIRDVITGKGGGCIVILHGRPGTGKTLTAEAIAEEGQKPLMIVSVGDLGKDAAELEQKLTDILEISKLWEAVLLLDEADVFLEARSLHELHRNAMVGVFLRLLEYHQRVMFLTTNRVTTLDEAFKSRISIAIKYRDLDKAARRKVWENFLGLAGCKIVDHGVVNGYDEGSTAVITKDEVNRLASKKLNGREIKNTTRTAQALAISLKTALGYDLLKQVLDVGEQFDKDFKETDTVGMYTAKGEELKDHYALYQ